MTFTTDLIDLALARHGGAERWERAETITARVHVYGAFWPYKGGAGLLGSETVTADLKRQRITMYPFGAGRTLTFDAAADQVTVTDIDGVVVDRLSHPRASMAGYRPDTTWSPTQIGYFISYATWMYLVEPFLCKLPGVESREIEPWEEDGEIWRRLELTFPESIASHSTVQTYYFDAITGLQRRMNYDVEVNGWVKVAHYTSEHKDFDGLTVATRRRVLLRDDDNIADHSSAAILLDLDDVQLHA